MTHFRTGHQFYLVDLPLLARISADLADAATDINIHPGATILRASGTGRARSSRETGG